MMMGVGGQALAASPAGRAAELAALDVSVDRFCSAGPDGGRCPIDELGQDLVELRRLINRLELAWSALAHHFDEAYEYGSQVETSAIGWLKAECRMGSTAAAERVCLGRQLERLPASAAALEAGGIGLQHLSLLAATAEALTTSATSRGFSEERLLKKARVRSLQSFRTDCAHYRHAQDPQAYLREELEGVEARSLELKPSQNGLLWLRGCLDGEGGALLRTALEPLARPREKEERLRERRLADALVELAGLGLDGGRLPRTGGVRPHLQITAGLETLRQLEGAPAAELEFAQPLSAGALERISCDCTITRVLLDPRSMVLDLGQATRVISPSQRRALIARDGGCRWPGCERPASYCSGHHLKHWIRGGATDLPNLALFCHWHHQRLHEGGWSAQLAPSGELVVLPPTTAYFAEARAPDDPGP